MVTCTIERGNDGVARFKNAVYDTFYSAKPDGSDRSNYQVIPSWMPERIPAAQTGWWRTFDTSARRVFDAENVNVPSAHPR